MLTLKDCMDFCDLTEAECNAIVGSTYVSGVVACALSQQADNSRDTQLLKSMQAYRDHIEQHTYIVNMPPQLSRAMNRTASTQHSI